MLKKSYAIILLIISVCLSSCIGEVWTGAGLVYDRHRVYMKIDDFQLGAEANRALFHDSLFKYNDCAIEVAVFHRDMLVVGRVPTEALRKEVEQRLATIPGKRRYLNALKVTRELESTTEDAWITTQIRSRILADSSIDPESFKLVTFYRTVYIMGDVMPLQAKKVLQIIRSTPKVVRMIKLLHYYHLTEEPSKAPRSVALAHD